MDIKIIALDLDGTLLTTDKRLLKYKSDTVKMMNPIDFIAEMEE